MSSFAYEVDRTKPKFLSGFVEHWNISRGALALVKSYPFDWSTRLPFTEKIELELVVENN